MSSDALPRRKIGSVSHSHADVYKVVVVGDAHNGGAIDTYQSIRTGAPTSSITDGDGERARETELSARR
jgi:hypothetical protein